jgi:hypothetical protein
MLLWPVAVHAYEPVDAKSLIKACWAISEEQRASGATGTMRHGAARTVGCLEQVVIEQVHFMFDETSLSPTKAQEWLGQLRIGIQKLYWAIYNGHRGCDPMCGTMYYLFHLPRNADVLERMIRDMADVRNDYGLAPKE